MTALLFRHRLCEGRDEHAGILGRLQVKVIDIGFIIVQLCRRRCQGQQTLQLQMIQSGVLTDAQTLFVADHLRHAAKAQLRHDLPQLLSDEAHEVDDMFRLSLKAAPQTGVLCGDADRTGIQVADAHHHAAHGDERTGGEAELLRPQQGGDRHIASAHQLAIRLQTDTAAQPVAYELILRLGKSQLPWQTGMVDRALRCSARPAVITGDQDDLRTGLGHAAGDRTDAFLTDELDRDARFGIGVFQIVDQLCQILDRIDVVMRRRRDERHARRGVPGRRDPRIDLAAGEMSAFSRLGSLCYLDLDLLCAVEVFASHTEAAAGHLLDGTVTLRAQPIRTFTALPAVALAVQPVHRDRQTGVGLLRDRSIGHRSRLEAADDVLYAFHLIQRDRTASLCIKGEQRSDRKGMMLLMDPLRIASEQLIIPFAHRLLQQDDRLWIIQMPLLVRSAAQTVKADGIQRVVHLHAQRIERAVVVPAEICLDV